MPISHLSINIHHDGDRLISAMVEGGDYDGPKSVQTAAICSVLARRFKHEANGGALQSAVFAYDGVRVTISPDAESKQAS